MTLREAIAKLDAEIAEAKDRQCKIVDDRYYEGWADGYLDGLEFERALIIETDEAN